MIKFDALTLKLFSDENADFFIGARVQKIQQPTRFELIFFIRNYGETKKFYINFSPDFYHVCFMSKENELRRNIVIPKIAPMFCMLLRKYIQNSKIIKVDVPKYERIFEIYFEYFDELGEKYQLCLAFELMGRYSNVILYNYDTNVIIGCAHNVGSEKSRNRELRGLLPYIYPEKQKKKNLYDVDFSIFQNNIDRDDIAKSIASKYHYFTMSFVSDLIDSIHDYSDKKIYNLLLGILNNKNYYPCISSDYSKYYIIQMKNCFACKNINNMIDEYFSYQQLKSLIFEFKSKINKNIKSHIEKLNLLRKKQEEQIQKMEDSNLYKTKADIIMANLYSLKFGIKNAKLYDFEGKEIQIILDDKITPEENANKYYTLYKKIKKASEHSLYMIEETKSKILYYEEMKFYTDNSQDAEELKEIYNEITEEKEAKEVNNRKIDIIDFIEYGGFKIYIGKNKKQNDYILSKLASSDDLWFHPLNAPGAHVLIKRNNLKENVSDNVILKAAQLTKEYSSLNNNSKSSIIYTKRKYIKKANHKQAFVTYKNETEIIV